MALAQPRGSAFRVTWSERVSLPFALNEKALEDTVASMTPLYRGIPLRHTLFTFFFKKNLFYKKVRPEICQNIRNMLRTYQTLRGEQFILSLLLLS